MGICPVTTAVPAPAAFTVLGPISLPATGGMSSWAPLPTPVGGDVTLEQDWAMLVMLSIYVDIAGNNVELAFSFDASGATVAPASGRPADRSHLYAKSPIGVSLTRTGLALLNAGTTHLELVHAGGAGTISDIDLTIAALAPIG